jgi:hypothetical protein
MKKLMSVLLGLSLMLGAATVSFAADPPAKKEKKVKAKKVKKTKKNEKK